jgi:hypothetical protein
MYLHLVLLFSRRAPSAPPRADGAAVGTPARTQRRFRKLAVGTVVDALCCATSLALQAVRGRLNPLVLPQDASALGRFCFRLATI